MSSYAIRFRSCAMSACVNDSGLPAQTYFMYKIVNTPQSYPLFCRGPTILTCRAAPLFNFPASISHSASLYFNCNQLAHVWGIKKHFKRNWCKCINILYRSDTSKYAIVSWLTVVITTKIRDLSQYYYFWLFKMYQIYTKFRWPRQRCVIKMSESQCFFFSNLITESPSLTTNIGKAVLTAIHTLSHQKAAQYPPSGRLQVQAQSNIFACFWPLPFHTQPTHSSRTNRTPHIPWPFREHTQLSHSCRINADTKLERRKKKENETMRSPKLSALYRVPMRMTVYAKGILPYYTPFPTKPVPNHPPFPPNTKTPPSTSVFFKLSFSSLD